VGSRFRLLFLKPARSLRVQVRWTGATDLDHGGWNGPAQTLLDQPVAQGPRRRESGRALERALIARSPQPGTSASGLALQSGTNANLLFEWRREYASGRAALAAPTTSVTARCPAGSFNCATRLSSMSIGRRRSSRLSNAAVQWQSCPSPWLTPGSDRCRRTLILSTSSANVLQRGPDNRRENWVGSAAARQTTKPNDCKG
jgi:transposase-like protein